MISFKKLSILLVPVLISGCATSGFEEDFGCPEETYETGYCESTADVYERIGRPETEKLSASSKPNSDVQSVTNSGVRDIREVASSQQDNQSSSRSEIIDHVTEKYVTANVPNRPIPIRTPARVMRIRVFPYEDSLTGALIAPGLVFTEVKERAWTIGKSESGLMANQTLSPLATKQGQ